MPSLEGERNIGLEVVQEKLFELCTTGPHHFTLVLDSDTMSSTLCLCSLQNCSSLLESTRLSSNHPWGGLNPPHPSSAGPSTIQTTLMLQASVLHPPQGKDCQVWLNPHWRNLFNPVGEEHSKKTPPRLL